jgi:hypothetical protein
MNRGRSILAGVLFLASSACNHHRASAIPDGYFVMVRHSLNIVGSSLAIYPDGYAVYRHGTGRLVRFRPSPASISRVRSVLAQPLLLSELRMLQARSSGADMEEWSFTFGNATHDFTCAQVQPLPVTTELIEAARAVAAQATKDEWFLSASECALRPAR